MGVNDAAEMLEAAKAEVVRLEQQVARLAAVIEKAIARWWRSAEMGDNGMYIYDDPETAMDDLWTILAAAADTDAALREVRAKAWDEGYLAGRLDDPTEPEWLHTGNPYREETTRG